MTGKKQDKILEYYDIYMKEVLPIFKDFEPIRQNILNEFRRKAFLKYFVIILVPLIIWLVAYLFKDMSTTFSFLNFYVPHQILPVLIIISIVYYYRERNRESRKFAPRMKEKVLPSLLKVFGDISWILHGTDEANLNNELINDKELDESGLFEPYNAKGTDDEFQGFYKNVPFVISETRLYQTTGRGASCVFSGIIMKFKFNKKIKNRTVAITKGDFINIIEHDIKQALIIYGAIFMFMLIFAIALRLNGGTSDFYLLPLLTLLTMITVFIVTRLFDKSKKPLNKVTLEDSKFDKRFEVYSSDQVEARYLITPSFMERFYNMQTAFGAKRLKCSFYGDNLMIAIWTTKNLFEICNLFKPLKDPDSINDFYKELDSVYKLIDYFKLNERTGI